jgi:hypothetical protein
MSQIFYLPLYSKINMKKIITLFLLFFNITNLYSQVGVGETLVEIRKKDSLGLFDSDNKKIGFTYVYDNPKVKSKFIYYLNINLVCYKTIVIPNDKKVAKFWRIKLNESKEWHKIKYKNRWFITKRDGSTITCLKNKDENNKIIYIFTKLN